MKLYQPVICELNITQISFWSHAYFSRMNEAPAFCAPNIFRYLVSNLKSSSLIINYSGRQRAVSFEFKLKNLRKKSTWTSWIKRGKNNNFHMIGKIMFSLIECHTLPLVGKQETLIALTLNWHVQGNFLLWLNTRNAFFLSSSQSYTFLFKLFAGFLMVFQLNSSFQ